MLRCCVPVSPKMNAGLELAWNFGSHMLVLLPCDSSKDRQGNRIELPPELPRLHRKKNIRVTAKRK